MSQDISSQPYRHMTNRHTDILSQDKSSHGHFVIGQIVTWIFCHTDILSQDKSSNGHIVTGQIVTRTYCHRTNRQMDILSQDKSSHGHIVTGQIVTWIFCHADINHPLPYPPPKNTDLVHPGYYSFLVWIPHISAYFGSSLHQFLSNACSRHFLRPFLKNFWVVQFLEQRTHPPPCYSNCVPPT